MTSADVARLRPFLDDLWRWKCGLPEIPVSLADFAVFCAAQWSPEFEGLMRRRLIMGALRYGRLGAPGKPQYDRLKSIRSRIDDYERTGNLEDLVDVANLCLIEYVEGKHPLRHFAAHGVDADEAGRHAEVIR